MNGGGGNDRLRVDDSHGAFTKFEKTTFNGGVGNDTLLGGRYAETLNGSGGNDTFTWSSGGADRIGGGTGLDAVTVSRTGGPDSTTVSPGSVPGTSRSAAARTSSAWRP